MDTTTKNSTKTKEILEKQVQAEQTEQSSLRGGGELGSYELPD